MSDQTGWPEFQCIIKNERWNLEYELEFAVTFFKFWWSLRRKKVEIPVVLDPEFADAQVADTNKVKELVYFCSILNRRESQTLGLRPDYLGFKRAYVGIFSTQFRHWILNQDLFLKDMISTKCPRPEKSKLSEPISTERLILRPLIPSDFQSFRSLREDPYVLHLLAGISWRVKPGE